MKYRMVDDITLSNFRKFMASGIPLDQFGPQGAFDAKPRRAKDEEGEGEMQELADALLCIMPKISREALKALLVALRAGSEEGEEVEAEDDGDPSEQISSPMQREMNQAAQDKRRKAKDAMRKAKDEPAPFEGKPETGAMDSASVKSFDAMFPEARHIKTSGAVYAEKSSNSANRGPATSASFDKMYPGAASVQAGDSKGMSLIYKGTVFTAWMDGREMPKVCFRIAANSGGWQIAGAR